MGRDWADYLPPQKRRRLERRRRVERLLHALRQRRALISYCLAIYLAWCLLLLLGGMTFPFGMALLTLLFLPPIAYLAWWLVWNEFNK
jgi:hypothetical protein